jgi:hypothetical protein
VDLVLVYIGCVKGLHGAAAGASGADEFGSVVGCAARGVETGPAFSMQDRWGFVFGTPWECDEVLAVIVFGLGCTRVSRWLNSG